MPALTHSTESWRSSFLERQAHAHTRNLRRRAHHLHRDGPPRQAGRRRRPRPLGDTIVLVTACAASNPREGIDFLPLTVDYREYTYASGRIPGGFFKREGKPSEKEVLTSRLIDRPIRPLFAAWLAPRNADHRPAHLRRRGKRLRRARDHRRLGGARAVEHPVHADDRRRPRRARGRAVRHQPDVRRAAAQPPRSHRRRHAGRPS